MKLLIYKPLALIAKKSLYVAAVLSAPIIFFDIGCLILARDRLRSLDVNYYSWIQSAQARASFDLGRGYPRYYFSSDPVKGFDITKNTNKVLVRSKPTESPSYEVWGNSIGCFDQDIPIGRKYAVYLAGDSFTWGYAPFASRFGQILEKNLGVDIASCGVSHTGQAHQFQKFKEISRSLGYYPNLVVVNVYYNDIDNDLSHPHSTVVDGYLVDVVQPKVLSESVFCLDRYSKDEVSERVRRYRSSGTGDAEGTLGLQLPLVQWMLGPERYSATFLLAREALQRVNKNLAQSRACSQYVPLKAPGVYDAMDQLYAINPFHDYPINSSIASASRAAIDNWIGHANANGYALVFSLIDIGKPPAFGDSFKEYIRSRGAVAWVFGESLPSRNIEYWNTLRWKNDGHLNLDGNLKYAQYLDLQISRLGGLADKVHRAQ